MAAGRSTALSPPKGSGGRTRKGGKPRPSNGSRGGSKKSLSGRFEAAATRADSLTGLAVFGAEVGGATLVASAASGYFGDKIKFGGEDAPMQVDARALVGLGLVTAGAWDHKKPNNHMVNLGLGALLSLMSEVGEDMGANARPVEEETPAGKTEAGTGSEGRAGVSSSEGVVLGSVDEAGAFWHRREKRLAIKMAKLKKRAAKHGIGLSDIKEEAQDIAEKRGWVDAAAPGGGGGAQVAVPPGYVLVPANQAAPPPARRRPFAIRFPRRRRRMRRLAV